MKFLKPDSGCDIYALAPALRAKSRLSPTILKIVRAATGLGARLASTFAHRYGGWIFAFVFWLGKVFLNFACRILGNLNRGPDYIGGALLAFWPPLGIKPSRKPCVDKSVEFVFARLAVFARKKIFYTHLVSSGPGDRPFQIVWVMMRPFMLNENWTITVRKNDAEPMFFLTKGWPQCFFVKNFLGWA